VVYITAYSVCIYWGGGDSIVIFFSSLLFTCSLDPLKVVVVRLPPAALGQVGVGLLSLLMMAALFAAAAATSGRVAPSAASFSSSAASAAAARGPRSELVIVSVPLCLPRVVELALVGTRRRLGVVAAAAAAVVRLALEQ
jgi:hypothetical protein